MFTFNYWGITEASTISPCKNQNCKHNGIRNVNGNKCVKYRAGHIWNWPYTYTSIFKSAVCDITYHIKCWFVCSC